MGDKAKADLDKEQKALQETEAASAKAQAELKIALANGTASKEMIAEAARLKAKVATQLDATNRAKDKLVAAESETKQKASESKKASDKAGALDRLAKAEKRLARDLMSKEGKAKMDAEDAVREQERAKRKESDAKGAASSAKNADGTAKSDNEKAKVEAATQSTKAAQEALHKASAAASSNSACGPDANPNTCMAHMRKMAADFNRYHAKTTSAMQKQHSAVVIVNKAISDNKQAVAAVAKTSKVAQTADEKAKSAETELKDANAASNIAEARKESAKTAETDVTNKAQKAAGDAKSIENKAQTADRT